MGGLLGLSLSEQKVIFLFCFLDYQDILFLSLFFVFCFLFLIFSFYFFYFVRFCLILFVLVLLLSSFLILIFSCLLKGVPRSLEISQFFSTAASMRIAAVYQQVTKGEEKPGDYLTTMAKYLNMALSHSAKQGSLDSEIGQKVVMEEYCAISSRLARVQVSEGGPVDPHRDSMALMKKRGDLLVAMLDGSLGQMVSCREKRKGLKTKKDKEASEVEEKRLIDKILFCFNKMSPHFEFMYFHYKKAGNEKEMGNVCGEAAFVFAVGSAWGMTPDGALHPEYSSILKKYLAALVKRSGPFFF